MQTGGNSDVKVRTLAQSDPQIKAFLSKPSPNEKQKGERLKEATQKVKQMQDYEALRKTVKHPHHDVHIGDKP